VGNRRRLLCLLVPLVVLAVPANYAMYTWARATGLSLGDPWLMTALDVATAALVTDWVQRRIGGGRLDNRVGFRLLLAFGLHVVKFGLAGWGCAALVTIPGIIHLHVSRSGKRAVGPALVATVASTAAAEALLGFGVFDMLLPARYQHLIALCLLVGTVMVTLGFGATEGRRRSAAQALEYAATHDDLTGLANRHQFMQQVEQAVGHHTTVLVADLDAFKDVNDRLGHAAGNQLLRVVADRLRAACADALVARLGGDEFAILLRATPAAGADRILDELAAPVEIAGEQLTPRASIGIASTDGQAVAAEELFRRADVAMYAAKHAGGARGATYVPGMDDAAAEQARIRIAIEQGLLYDRFRLLYQPVVELPHGRLTGVEALIRLQDADGSIVGPDQFIPVAEATGLIVPVGRWVIDTACRQAADWRRRFGDHAPARVNINVSARQLQDPHLFDDITAALAAHQLPAAAIVVEITETAALGGDQSIEVLRRLRQAGVGIALDDFGTGYSSLSLLMTCPADTIKIDKSFVSHIEGSPEHAAVVHRLGDIAASLRLRVVAEGVETADQATTLHGMGYRHAQGFHFARPLPPGEIEDLLTPAAIIGA
jgi:diguanylate cyclase (GGDEF)-like protein